MVGSGEYIFLPMGIDVRSESDYVNGRRTGENEQASDLSVRAVFLFDHLCDLCLKSIYFYALASC